MNPGQISFYEWPMSDETITQEHVAVQRFNTEVNWQALVKLTTSPTCNRPTNQVKHTVYDLRSFYYRRLRFALLCLAIHEILGRDNLIVPYLELATSLLSFADQMTCVPHRHTTDRRLSDTAHRLIPNTHNPFYTTGPVRLSITDPLCSLSILLLTRFCCLKLPPLFMLVTSAYVQLRCQRRLARQQPLLVYCKAI